MCLNNEEKIILRSVKELNFKDNIAKKSLYIKKLEQLKIDSYNDEDELFELREEMNEIVNHLINRLEEISELRFREVINKLPNINVME